MKRFLITLLVAVIVFSGSYLFFTNYLNILDANNFREEVEGVELGEGNVIEQVVDHEILFLFAGVDAEQGTGSRVRTDSLMLFKIDISTGEIDIVSIPRDTQVLVRGEWDKVNHAHAYGGMTLTLRTIREWLGIDLDYYVKLDFDAVVEIVDAMGGVYVDIPILIEDEKFGIYLEPGRQLLNGEEALYYARYRKGYENGDLGRVQAQQNLMIEIIRQALDPKNIPKLPSFVSIYITKVDTNIPLDTILDLIPVADQMNTEGIDTYIIPGEAGYENNTSYYFYYEEPTMELVDEVLDNYKLDNQNTETEIETGE